MALEKKQINFIIDCDVEEIVSLLQEDYGMKILDAFNTVYNSNIYKKLIDTETGLYIQSPLYIYEYLKEEINESKQKEKIAISSTTEDNWLTYISKPFISCRREAIPRKMGRKWNSWTMNRCSRAADSTPEPWMPPAFLPSKARQRLSWKMTTAYIADISYKRKATTQWYSTLPAVATQAVAC